MTYRMIAIDLDGTLLCPRGTVTPRTKAAIHKALGAGLLVCFATGRNFTESKTVLEAVDHHATAVFVGGAVVMDCSKQVTLHRTLLPAPLARELCQELEGLGHAALALQDRADGADYLVTDVPLNHATEQWMRVTSATVERVKDLATHPHSHTLRVGICSAPGEVAQAKAVLDQKYKGRLFYHSLVVPAYGVEVLEAFDPAVSKWAGILKIAGNHGIRGEEIIAIGDDVNDIAMIRHAGLGVAMGNAHPDVLALAKKVIKPNAEEGLALFLEELVQTHAVRPLEGDAAA
jgi:Cof subfamily protein (haloacid dehalogenase superfamily)